MTQKEVEIGKVYAMKVSGIIAPVRVDRKDTSKLNHSRRVLSGMNLRTGREVHMSAAKLRYEVEKVDGKWRRRTAAPAPAVEPKPDTMEA